MIITLKLAHICIRNTCKRLRSVAFRVSPSRIRSFASWSIETKWPSWARMSLKDAWPIRLSRPADIRDVTSGPVIDWRWTSLIHAAWTTEQDECTRPDWIPTTVSIFSTTHKNHVVCSVLQGSYVKSTSRHVLVYLMLSLLYSLAYWWKDSWSDGIDGRYLYYITFSIISGLTMPSCSHKCGLATKIFHFSYRAGRCSRNYDSPCMCSTWQLQWFKIAVISLCLSNFKQETRIAL